MRVDLIGHASLHVQAGGLTLVTDPWWAGPAYAEQWYPWPFPVPERYDLDAVDLVYLSHGHEDHLHAPTLLGLPRTAELLLPASYDEGNRRYVSELGFSQVTEIPSGQTIERGGARFTLYTYLGDSLLVVESEGEVMLNVNDALHAARREVIEEYCTLLARRFPRIDYLFCGFGGASYFPNCFRLPGKDDVRVAQRRERFFIDNLALIARRLQPRFVFPFAAHFVLPSPHAWWISEERLRAEPPATVLGGVCSGVTFVDLKPGDHVEAGRVSLQPLSEVGPEEVRRRVLERWPPAMRPARIGDDELERLIALLSGKSAGLSPPPLDAIVRLWDHPERAIRVRSERGRVTVGIVPATESAPLELETRSQLLSAAATQDYGRDLICIGYGAIVRVASPEAVRQNLHERLLDLLTSYPSWRERLERHPLKCMRFLARDPGARLAFRKGLLGSRQRSSPLYALEAWI